MRDADIAWAGARGQLAAMEAGSTTARALMETLLLRIERLDPDLCAFRVVLREEALAAADAADQARAAGDTRPLLGLPVAVKDDTDVAGVTSLMGAGSRQPPAHRDAPIVERLRAAGAVIVGKTNLPELALWGLTASIWHGTTRNPWDRTRTPGGSSGGSAAAVGAGLVALATGSDGLGSLRIPAAACGLVTLKPTRGLIPQRDPGWHGMSEVGLLARDVADLRLGLAVVCDLGEHSHPAEALVTPVRVGWALSAPGPTRLDPAVRLAVEAVVGAAAAMGSPVRRVKVPYGPWTVAASLVRTWLVGAARDRARLVEPDRVERRTVRLTRLGSAAERLLPWALREGERLRERIDQLWDQVDVLVLPATATLPPAADAIDHAGLLRTALRNARWGPFTGAFNASGHPALVLPALRSPEGLPVGVQLVGRYGSDERLLDFAAVLESRLDLPGVRPPVG